jgi:hypothetical protein
VARISRSAGLFIGFFGNRTYVWGVVSTFSVLFLFSYLLSGLKLFQPKTEVPTVAEFFAEFPMRFQSNDGAFTDEVKYFSKGYQFDLLFMNDEVLLNLYSNEQDGETTDGISRTRLSQLSLKFIGTDGASLIKGLGPLQLTEARNSQAKSDAPFGYTEVKYANVFPGVDVYFHGKQKQLFYEFVLNERAQPDRLRMRLNGIDNAGDVEIDMHGNIVVKCRGKKMLIQKPMVYRLVKQKKQLVNGYFYVTRENEIHFKAVESYRAASNPSGATPAT